jgi:predicted anti-sigma-YlaC factor YlaD
MREAPQSLICERVCAQISLELDGELSRLEQALVEAHIEHCESCRLYRADLFAFTGQLRAAPLERLSRRVELPRRQRRVTLRAAQAVAAAAVVAVGIVSAVGIRAGESPRLEKVRPAFLQSPEYELRLIHANRQRHAPNVL